MPISKYLVALAFTLTAPIAFAEILPKAEVMIKIPLVKKPTTRPMTVAYEPNFKHYIIADGGLAPMGSEFEAPSSKSEIHAYSDTGEYINSAKPGYDNRSIYFNPHTNQIETVTYNISSDAGFFPNTGIFGLTLSDKGEVTTKSTDVTRFNAAFGDAATMPSYNPDTKQYYAKQERSNKVFVVSLDSSKKVGEIALDIKKAGAEFHDIADSYIAYTGVKNEELCVIDIDHKAALIFNLKGEFVGKSDIPKNIKLRAQNHYTGVGYTNGMLFAFFEQDGEFGTYYGLKVVK